jgi:hypothetical protein
MARVLPSLPPRRAWSAGLAAELQALWELAEGLSDAYTLFHSVDWSVGSGPAEHHGEIDIVVVNQAGDLMLVEVKSGEVEFRADGIFKRYERGDARSVDQQGRFQYNALRTRLAEAGLKVRVHQLLVLPDMQVQGGSVQWPRERIVDASGMAHLVGTVVEQMGAGFPSADAHARVLAFLENRFRVLPDVSALSGRLMAASTRLSAGLATWVPRMTVPSGLVRVLGTAGSGKTQLALRLLREAAERGERAAYFCFNRALADHIASVAPLRTRAETFHEYAVRLCRQAGVTVDFTQPGVFDRVAQACVDIVRDAEPDLDLVVLDECQDLQPEWVEALLSRLRERGRAVLLEDPGQQLYPDRVPFDLPDAVTVRAMDNFRSPRAIVRLINGLGLSDEAVEACSPFEGELPDPIDYSDAAACLRATQKAVQRCLDAGFGLEDVAVISLKGREKSALLQCDSLGPWPVRRFTGAYDEGGGAIWTQGDLLVESVRRFKGQAAPAVVLTECDFDGLDERARRLLFVGMTRARVRLEWVVSERVAKVVSDEVEE